MAVQLSKIEDMEQQQALPLLTCRAPRDLDVQRIIHRGLKRDTPCPRLSAVLYFRDKDNEIFHAPRNQAREGRADEAVILEQCHRIRRRGQNPVLRKVDQEGRTERSRQI